VYEVRRRRTSHGEPERIFVNDHVIVAQLLVLGCSALPDRRAVSILVFIVRDDGLAYCEPHWCNPHMFANLMAWLVSVVPARK